jgi:hypothetical protein
MYWLILHRIEANEHGKAKTFTRRDYIPKAKKLAALPNTL